MSGDDVRRFLREGLLEYYRHVYLFRSQKKGVELKLRGSALTRHEYVKGLLFELGKREGLMPLPEYFAALPSKKRIDMLWTNRQGDQVAAFEVDQSIYPKSIKKLSHLHHSCRKFIVSAGIGRKPLQRNLLADTEIVCIDVTMKALGVLAYFYSRV